MRIEPKKIMCAIDFSEHADMVLSYGRALARQFESRLCICHVVSTGHLVSSHMTPYIDYVGLEAERLKDSQQRLERIAVQMDMECEVYVLTGSPAEVICETAEKQNVDMVIAATHGGSGIRRFLIGSVTDRLLKILPCPLLVLQPPEKGSKMVVPDEMKFKRILVGCDFSKDSARAFDYALSLAQEFEAQLYLAHVIRPLEKEPFWDLEASSSPDDSEITTWSSNGYLNPQIKLAGATPVQKATLMDEIEQKLLDLVPEDSQSWCTPATVILEGEPYRELVEYAKIKQTDLIVLGVHGHSFFERFIVGPTTDRVIPRAGCPVLVVRSKSGALPLRAEKDGAEAGTVHTGLCAADIMQKDVISVSPETDITAAASILLEHHINGVPVLGENGTIKGILCQSDLIFQQKEIPVPPIFSMLDSVIPLSLSNQVKQELEKISAVTVSQAMVEEVVTVTPNTPVSKIADLMVEKHYHTIPVIQDGKLVGIIGKEDILKVLVTVSGAEIPI